MAKKTNVASTFRITAIVVAALLLTAAALTHFRGAGGNGPVAELAALSQAIPAHSGAALAGGDGSFDRLDSSLKRIIALRHSSGPSLPGSSRDWQQLESRAAAMLDKRSSVETLYDAAGNIGTSLSRILELSNELFDRAGNPGVIQEFQQRAARLGQSANRLPQDNDTVTAAAGIADDVAFLRAVTNALGGEDSELDMRALNAADREALVVPLQRSRDGAGVSGRANRRHCRRGQWPGRCAVGD